MELLETLQDSDQFWQVHRQQLYYFVLKRVSDPAAAEDIVQIVLEKVYLHLDTLRDQERFLPWLYQITRNVIIDYYRRGKSEEALTAVKGLEAEEEIPSVYEQLAPCILPLIKKLPSPYREAVQWSEIDDLPHKEIAARLGISLSGAKSQVQRGRKQLLALLQQCCQMQLDPDGKLLHYEVKSDCRKCNPA